MLNDSVGVGIVSVADVAMNHTVEMPDNGVSIDLLKVWLKVLEDESFRMRWTTFPGGVPHHREEPGPVEVREPSVRLDV